MLIASCRLAGLNHRLSAFAVHSRLGSRINLFEACSAFTHVTACLFAKSPKATLYTRGSGSFVTSTAAPIATGWSDLSCRAGLSPADFSAFARRTMKRVANHGSSERDAEL